MSQSTGKQVSEEHTTAPEDRIPFLEKLGYGSGMLSFQLCNSALPQLAYPVYNVVMGLPAAWVGWVLTIGRLWDAFTDPVMGHISDNSRTRWGRRKPFILIGALLSALLYIGVWFVPENISDVSTFVYLLIASLLFFTAFTVFAVPYTSQGYELTPDYHERTRLMGVRAYFSALLGVIIPWIFAIAQWDVFESTMAGVRFLSVLVAILIVIAAIPTLFVTERTEKRVAGQKKVSLVWGMKETLKNRAFLSLIGLTVSTHMAMISVQSLGFYVSTYHVFGGDKVKGGIYMGATGTILTISGLISIPIITWLARRFGKVRVMAAVMVLAMIGDLSKWVLYNPSYPWMQLIVPCLIGPAGSAFWILVNSMKADVPDDDELRTGMRREGMFGAMATWIQKFGMSICFIITGAVLGAVRFDPDMTVQASATIQGLRVAFVLIPVAGELTSLIILKFYPLTEARMHEIRVELEQRRGKL